MKIIKRLVITFVVVFAIVIIVSLFSDPFKDDRNEADKICRSIEKGMVMEEVLSLIDNPNIKYEATKKEIVIGHGSCWCMARLENKIVKAAPGGSACPY